MTLGTLIQVYSAVRKSEIFASSFRLKPWMSGNCQGLNVAALGALAKSTLEDAGVIIINGGASDMA